MKEIATKRELKEFLEVELGRLKKSCNKYILCCPFIIYEEQIKYRLIKLLRKAEFHTNSHHLLRGKYYRYRLFNYETRNRMFIPMNAIDKGINIAHIGDIVINDNARVGKNVKIYPGIVIGNNEFKDHVKCPIIGDNVFIGPGVKIIGDIRIVDNCIIAANSVVTKSIEEPNSVVAGIPAKVIKKHSYY